MEQKQHLKKFTNANEYDSQKNEIMGIPHVVLLTETNEVKYCFENQNEIDYSKEYFTIEALEDGEITLLSNRELYYSLNNGEWILLPRNNALSYQKNDKIRFKCTCSSFNGVNAGKSPFSINGTFNAYGNVMSLLYSDNFEEQYTLTANNTLNGLFSTHSIISAQHLILPATTLTSGCYYSMFSHCTSLTTAPQLPATTLSSDCYNCMFGYCTSLTEAPELLATTLTYGCYSNIFNGCSSLNKITMLATDISASNCLSYWVNGVSKQGTFIKHPQMNSLPNGTNGIPSGWTVEDYQN